MNDEIVFKSNKELKYLWNAAIVLIAVLFFVALGTQVITFASDIGTVLTIDTSLNAQPEQQNGEDGGGGGNEYSQQTLTITEETPWVWHPISVVNEPMNGFNAIRKTYALPPDVNPAVISTSSFEMFGQSFTFAYVIQQPTTSESFKEVRETVTIETRTQDLSDILANLEQEIWYERDGFAGTLTLDIHSITSTAAGTARHTTTATRQRTFPHLSSPDNSFIPRTIEDGGTIFTLTSVDWQSVGTSFIDGHPMPSSYTANATYSAQVTQTRTTGYTTTAEFVGNVFRVAQGMTLFTAVFYGEPIVEVWLDGSNGTTNGGIGNSSNSSGNGNGGGGSGTPLGNANGDGQGSGSSLGSNSTESPNSNPNTTTPSTSENHQIGTSWGANDVVSTILAAIGIVIAFGVIAVGGFFLAKSFRSHSVTIYNINSPREIVKAGKIKLNPNDPEPIILLNDTASRSPAKMDRYIIQIAKKTVSKLIGKNLRVILYDKEAIHRVPDSALNTPIYEFEVNFSDDEDEMFDESGTFDESGVLD